MELLLKGVDILLHLDKYLDIMIQTMGLWSYVIIFFIIFCETGLVVTPVLPGDSLLFAIGTFAALGIVSALYHRKVTGEGQSVDVSMADGLFSLLFDEPLDCYGRLGLNAQQGNRIMRFSPFNAYRTSDGWVTIGCATDTEWSALLGVIGHEPLEEFERVSGRLANNASVDRLVGDWARTLTSAQVARMLPAASLTQFAALKAEVDPGETLQTALYRRALRGALP